MQLINQYEKLAARLWARPKKIAFLVDDSFQDRDINNVVRYCLRHLGGRCNAIVPIEPDHLGTGWEKLLASIDPDILYTFTPLSEEFQLRLNKTLRPTRFITANPAHRHSDGWHISEGEIGGIRLADADLPFGESILGKPSCPQIILDDLDQRSDAAVSFCIRNFGAFSENDWKAFCLESKGIKMLPVKSVSDPESFLASMLPSAGRLYPSQLSTAGYEHDLFRCNLGDSAEVYEIAVGDSIRDFLYAWNRSITLRFNWRRRALWVPSSAISSETMIANIAQWIRECRFEQGNVQCNILSYSVSEPELQTLVKKLQPQIHMKTNHLVLEKDQACEMHGMSLSGCSKKTHRFEFGQSDTAFGVPYPEHVLSSKLSNQGWMVEIEFESPKDNISCNFKDSVWHLPVRYRLDKQFMVNRQIGSRISSQGHLVVEVSADKRSFPIDIPTVKKFCDVLLVEPMQTGSGAETAFKVGTFRRIDTSSDGQYFWSILRLFGSLQSAKNFLDDDGWRNVLYDMIGSDRIMADEVDALLEKFVQQAANAKNANSHVRSKARRQLVKALLEMPSEHRFVHRSLIVKRLEEAGTILPGDNDDFIDRQLHFYLSKNIFLQGADARCYNCGSANWFRIDDLKTTMSCQGCSSDFCLPPIDSVSFRLNDLISNGARRLGLLPVFQALFKLHMHARNHFLFLPQQDLFDWTPNEEKQVTDLDLIGILDGRYFIGEVKSGETGLLGINIDQTEEIALELLPDFLLIAAPAKAFTKKAQEHCKKLEQKLKGSKVRSEFMPLSWTEVVRPNVQCSSEDPPSNVDEVRRL